MIVAFGDLQCVIGTLSGTFLFSNEKLKEQILLSCSDPLAHQVADTELVLLLLAAVAPMAISVGHDHSPIMSLLKAPLGSNDADVDLTIKSWARPEIFAGSAGAYLVVVLILYLVRRREQPYPQSPTETATCISMHTSLKPTLYNWYAMSSG